MKLCLSLLILCQLNKINCNTEKCNKPNQVYHNPITNEVCTDGCKAGCYCKHGYKMNAAGDCVPGDPKGEYFQDIFQRNHKKIVYSFKIVDGQTWNTTAVVIYARTGADYREIQFAVWQHSNAKAIAFVSRDISMRWTLKNACPWRSVRASAFTELYDNINKQTLRKILKRH